jgi:NADP-dependent 3-hydroxy acid dehydrogenase YdfG
MPSLRDQFAVVTGASSGIGRAITLGLAEEGAKLCLTGRRSDHLNEIAARAGHYTASIQPFCADLTRDEDISALVNHVNVVSGTLDLLIHCAGEVHQADHASAPVSELDSQYRINVRGPYLLTQALLPLLSAGRGQIVFINSSVGLRARRGNGQYAATKHALKAVADSLREEVNADGIRVLSVFPGRTATPRMEQVFREEGRAYRPELLMQPEDVAAMVVQALKLPRTAEVTEISMRPLLKSY